MNYVNINQRGFKMNQSNLNFKENTKTCVWCDFDGLLEFYWENRYGQVLITPERYGKICVPEDANSSLVRKEIKNWLKANFNV